MLIRVLVEVPDEILMAISPEETLALKRNATAFLNEHPEVLQQILLPRLEEATRP